MIDIVRFSQEHNMRISVHWWESSDKQHNALFVYMSRMIFSGPTGDCYSEFVHHGVLTDTMKMTDEEFDTKLTDIFMEGYKSLNDQEKRKRARWEQLPCYHPSVLFSKPYVKEGK